MPPYGTAANTKYQTKLHSWRKIHIFPSPKKTHQRTAFYLILQYPFWQVKKVQPNHVKLLSKEMGCFFYIEGVNISGDYLEF